MIPVPIPIDFFQYSAQLKTKKENGKRYVFDPVRKKYLVWQPEEMVRQLVLLHLLNKEMYNPNRISVEKEFEINTLTQNALSKRWDILVYDPSLQPWLAIECKSPFTTINQKVFDQLARYNMELKVKFFLLTNGNINYCCSIDHKTRSYIHLEQLPPYPF